MIFKRLKSTERNLNMLSSDLLLNCESDVMYKLLIVDDHPIFRQAITGIIADKFTGSSCIEADSIESAKTYISQHTDIDLVLLDLNMPSTSGLNGLLELRNEYPNLPVVIVTDWPKTGRLALSDASTFLLEDALLHQHQAFRRG